MSPPALQVRGLCKRFGNTVALADVSFTLQPGDSLALVGANGAGKSTLIRILATLLHPDQGEISVMGLSHADTFAVRRQLGYMPDVLGVYEEMLVREYLDFFARAHGVPESLLAHRIEEVTRFAGLEERREATCGSLSRGYQQRLALARAMLGDPAVYLMDEPASGLDPVARADFRTRLLELKRRGRTVLISSHVLADLQEVCSHLAIIEKGILQVFEPMEGFLRRTRRENLWRIAVERDGDALLAWMQARSEVRTVRWDGGALVFDLFPDRVVEAATEGEMGGQRGREALQQAASATEEAPPQEAPRSAPAQLLRAAVQAGFAVEHFAPLKQDLETAYLSTTTGPA